MVARSVGWQTHRISITIHISSRASSRHGSDGERRCICGAGEERERAAPKGQCEGTTWVTVQHLRLHVPWLYHRPLACAKSVKPDKTQFTAAGDLVSKVWSRQTVRRLDARIFATHRYDCTVSPHHLQLYSYCVPVTPLRVEQSDTERAAAVAAQSDTNSTRIAWARGVGW